MVLINFSMVHLVEYSDLSSFDLFVHQIYGYYLLISNIVDPVSHIAHNHWTLKSGNFLFL